MDSAPQGSGSNDFSFGGGGGSFRDPSQSYNFLPSTYSSFGPPVMPSDQLKIPPGGDFSLVPYNNNGPSRENQQTAVNVNPAPPPDTTAQCFQGSAALVTTLVLVMGVVACTVVFAVMLSRQSNNVSSSMLVHTSRRTRDWATANSYSMYSFDEDQYTRFYVCMKSAGVNVSANANTKNPESIGLYRDAAKNRYECGAESDRGWPKDIGFLRCIQKRFNADFHQSNMFQQCLELTEGGMFENIQTDASTLFLGSYNYVALLLTAMGVMAGFLIFTAGGIYLSSEIKPNDDSEDEEVSSEQDASLRDNKNGMTMNVRNMVDFKNMKKIFKQPVNIESEYNYVASAWQWVPLAAVPNGLAFVWSLTMLFASFFYTYPLKDTWSDVVSVDDGASVFPGTPWTGNMCCGMSFLMGTYFLLCFIEWYRDSMVKKGVDSAKKMNQTLALVQTAQREASNIPDQKAASNIPDQKAASNIPGQQSGGNPYKDYSHRYMDLYDNAGSKFSRQEHTRTLGARYNTQLYYADKGFKDMSLRMTPLLNKVYALAWVFADGLLFVGMINSQNSPLNENVVAIWFFIIMCRAFQFAATYFMDDVLFIRVRPPPLPPSKDLQVIHNSQNALYSKFYIGFGKETIKFYANTSKEFWVQEHALAIHAGISVVCCHLASLWCLITVIYHFANAISIPMGLKEYGVNTSVHVIQICFIAFIFVMDLLKHGHVFSTVMGWIDQHSYWYWMTSIFTVDWVVRAIFIICMLFPITQYFGDVNSGLNDYVRMTVSQ